MSIQKRVFIFTAIMAVLFLIIMPASAVILEEQYKGQISRLEPSKNTITMQVTSVYEGGEWVTYAKSSLKNNIVSGTINNPDIFSDLKQGNPVEAVILGGPGGEWIAIGKIGNVDSTTTPLTAAYGIPDRLISPYYRGYTIKTELTPNCAECEGTTCTAQSAKVVVERDGAVVEEKTMYPGETHVFGWNSDYQYIIQVKFNSGEASSDSCPAFEGIVGPQPISDFTVYDTQRSSVLVTNPVPTVTDTAETTAETTVPTQTQTAEETVSQTSEPMPKATQTGTNVGVVFLMAVFGVSMAVFKRRN